jgi:hypothetical protein
MSPNSSAASTAARSPRMSAQSVRRKRHGGVASAGYVSGRSSGPRRLPPVRLPEGVVEHRGDIVRRRTSLDSMSSGTRYGTNRAYALRARGPDARANPRGQGLPEAPERATLGTAVRRLDAARHVRSSAAKGRRLAFAGLAAPAPSSGWAVEARPAHPAGTTEPEHQAARRGHAALMPWVSTSTTRPRVPKSCPSTGKEQADHGQQYLLAPVPGERQGQQSLLVRRLERAGHVLGRSTRGNPIARFPRRS